MAWSKKSSGKPKIVRKRLADGSIRVYEYARTKTPPAPRPPDSLAMLIEAYQRSPEWARLSDARKAHCTVYFRYLDGLGNYRRDTIERPHIRTIRDAIFHTGRPGAANGFVNVTSAMFGWAVKADLMKHNPATGITSIPGGHFPAWDQHTADAAIAALPEHLRRLVLVALYTGQRRGDLCRMAWSNYDGERLRITQGKTGVSLVIPVHPVLAAEMDAWERRATTILVNAHGRPWKAPSATVGMHKALLRLGFPAGWNIHGLRKLAASNLAEAGCSAHEIMAITGHKTMGMVSLYTKGADQERMATAAIIRLQTRKA